ncbi:hypothetical protein [Demequina sp.]|uniref:hypothetical protein n=1 Tax=Demequina sp. TaxID=2050685 RepID=UPI003D145567
MDRHFHGRGKKSPRSRMLASGGGPEFFPGEAAEILGLAHVDHARLRRLVVLRRECAGDSGPTAGRWLRLGLDDLMAVRVLVDIGGGLERLVAGRRLKTSGIAEVCSALRAMGIADPLIQVPIARQGDHVVAYLAASWVDPSTGQLLFNEVFTRTDAYLAGTQSPIEELEALRAEITRHAASAWRGQRGDPGAAD